MAKRLTDADWKTIRTALSYAIIERDGFADATRDSANDKDAHDRAVALVERFEKLHQQIFGEPSDFAQQSAADAALPSISIFELMARTTPRD